MKLQGLDDLYLWKKQQIKLLLEVLDLTEQLDEAVNRRDSVSVNMLLAMREGPIRQARELEDRSREYLNTLPEEAAIHLNALLSGEDPAAPEEEQLTTQVSQFRRTLEKIQALDKNVSLLLGGNQSFYRTFR